MNFLTLFWLIVSFAAAATADKLPGQFSEFQRGWDIKNLAEHRSYSESKVQQNWIANGVVPSYIKDFLKILQTTDPDDLSDILSRLLEGVQSTACKGHTLELIWRIMNITETIRQGDREVWALHMVDAWGKLPEGFLMGHTSLYGDFYECIGAKARDIDLLNGYITDNVPTQFEGQYCTSYLFDYTTAMSAIGRLDSPAAMQSELDLKDMGVNDAESAQDLLKLMASMSMGSCLPSTCSQEDNMNILVNVFNMTYSLIKKVSPDLSMEFLPWPVTVGCYVEKKKSLDAAAITVIILLSILLALGLSAGIYDYWLSRREDCQVPDSKVVKYFLAFSVYTNTKKWLSTRRSADDFGCLHGIRFLSTAWVVLAHSYLAFALQPQWNMVDMINIWKDWTVLAVLNGTFSVDTFFVMSGMLATYNILKMLDRTKGKFNVILFYIHRYIRLTPTYAILVAIAAILWYPTPETDHFGLTLKRQKKTAGKIGGLISFTLITCTRLIRCKFIAKGGMIGRYVWKQKTKNTTR